MLTPNWKAHCDLCGRFERTKVVTGQDKENEHYLHDGWVITHKKNIMLCPECLAIVRRIW